MNFKRKNICDRKSLYRGRAFFNEREIRENLNRPVVLEYVRENGCTLCRETAVGILKGLSYENIEIRFGKVPRNDSQNGDVSFQDSEFPFNFFNLLSIYDEKGRLLYYNRCLYKSVNERIIPSYKQENPLVAAILN